MPQLSLKSCFVGVVLLILLGLPQDASCLQSVALHLVKLAPFSVSKRARKTEPTLSLLQVGLVFSQILVHDR